ncbi:hypothetical protein Bhyg_09175 [Pseudolycoriella hygida]|uniref:Uncharacterized protein n=1 Tax=Pseudolycoriella hygida TaxID=35572 RepID=A0A9Q0N5Z7_9DIPT|nr:hypothetical protein Bhyg_09175 [Pseudolycoriella hygida]
MKVKLYVRSDRKFVETNVTIRLGTNATEIGMFVTLDIRLVETTVMIPLDMSAILEDSFVTWDTKLVETIAMILSDKLVIFDDNEQGEDYEAYEDDLDECYDDGSNATEDRLFVILDIRLVETAVMIPLDLSAILEDSFVPGDTKLVETIAMILSDKLVIFDE